MLNPKIGPIIGTSVIVRDGGKMDPGSILEISPEVKHVYKLLPGKERIHLLPFHIIQKEIYVGWPEWIEVRRDRYVRKTEKFYLHDDGKYYMKLADEDLPDTGTEILLLK